MTEDERAAWDRSVDYARRKGDPPRKTHFVDVGIVLAADGELRRLRAERDDTESAFVEFNEGTPAGPTITIKTVYTAGGWTTTVVMPDGEKYRRSMRRKGGGGVFVGTREGDFYSDGLPDEVADMAEDCDHMDVVRFLND